ncbi:MAG: alpha/beta hydrolase [Acidimicrobiales bacterium]
MPLDPCFRSLLDSIAERAGVAAPGVDPVAAARAGVGAMFTHAAAPAVQVVDRTIPGDIPVRIYMPDNAGDALPMVVLFHGGGFIAGSPDSHDGGARELCAQADAIVVSVDYRLAPEHKFPAAADDCHAALLWTAAHAAELGGDATRLAITGDSAGGNLAAAVALMNRDRGGPPLALQALVYPVIDPSCATPSAVANGEGYLLTTASMKWMWSLYVNGAEDYANPYAAPIAAASLAGLPPALVITAEFDPLRDEGEAYGRALEAAGVPVTISRYDGMIHGFASCFDITPRAGEATGEIADALKAAWA